MKTAMRSSEDFSAIIPCEDEGFKAEIGLHNGGNMLNEIKI